MPHKKRANKNHIQVKKILANSELSLIDKKKSKKSFERVPRHDNNPNDRKIEERILNDDSDDDKKIKKLELKKHINKELQQSKNSLIPKKSRKNKYYLMNHPELKDIITTIPKINKRKHQSDEQEEKEEQQNEPPKKKISEESKPSICDKLVAHMITSRFRYLNEKLYTSASKDAQKMFQQDPQSFYAYHQGYSVSFS
jgi:ribosomal RNA-processing protein 8